MKLNGHSLFPALSLSLCSVLTLGFLIAGPASPGANEILSSAPEAFSDTFLSQCSAYYSDHFFGRQQLIAGYARLHAALLSSSIREDVVLGKDGWLFYASTLSDYAGENRLNLSRAAHNLKLMAEYCQKKGVQFLFLGVPNKNTLYPEQMPNRYTGSRHHDLHRMNQILDVPHLELEALHPPYFAHDSHWNSQGAAIAADAINLALGRSSEYHLDAFSESGPHQGDLYDMLYPGSQDSETDPVYGGSLSYSFGENSGKKPDSITIRTNSNADGSLLMYRDSFGNSLYPYLADSFGTATFSRSTAYDLSNLEGVDAVVIELVERNLGYLTRYAPVMPAVKESLPKNSSIIPCEFTTRPSSIPGYTLYQGTAKDGKIYLCTDEGAYSCFLLDEGGFAAHIPMNLNVTGIIIQ